MGDKIVLQSFVAMQPLHVSELELLDTPGCKEVSFLILKRSILKCFLFLSITNIQSN